MVSHFSSTFGSMWYNLKFHSLILSCSLLSNLYYSLQVHVRSGDIHFNPGPSPASEVVDQLSVFHLNTRSIRKKLPHLFNALKDVHVCTFTETHLDNNIDSETCQKLQWDGFHPPFRKDRNCFWWWHSIVS